MSAPRGADDTRTRRPKAQKSILPKQFVIDPRGDHRSGKDNLVFNSAYQQVLEIISSGAFVVGLDYRPVYVNRAFCDMTGVLKEDALRSKCYEAFPGPHCGTEACPLRRVIGGEDRFTCELRKSRADGVIMPFRITATGIRGNSGTTIGAVLEFVELHEVHLAEQNLEIQARKLEIQKRLLDEREIAIRQLARGVEAERERIEHRFHISFNRIVSPLLKVAMSEAHEPLRSKLQLIAESIKDIASPLLDENEAGLTSLSPREMEICNMVRRGLSSKDIARILSVAEGTVEQQRKRIRRKLGLKGTPTNLSSHLRATRR